MDNNDAFYHWHIHFHGSKFDGMITGQEAEEDIDKYQKKAYAITDHGTMNSVLELHEVCKKKKIKFVPGSEMYVVNDKEEKFDGPKKKKFDKKRHIVLLAINQKGFENLIYLSSLASMYYYMKPRIDHRDIFERNEGLVCLTACLGGIVSVPYLWDDAANEQEKEKNALDIASQYKEVFKDRFFLEIQPVEKIEQLKLNNFLIDISRKYNFGIIATNDAHYAKPEHYEIHARLISLQNMHKDQNDNDLVYKKGHHLRSYSEMVEAFMQNGTLNAENFSKVTEALENANNLHEIFEGVVIEKKLRIPLYREQDGI